MPIILPGQTAFLKFELENGNARRKKVALQEITRQYRQGEHLNAESRNAFEKIINGIVLSESDLKVVRWCLNALARLGTRQGSSKYVIAALEQFQHEPEISAAAVAALARMFHGNLEAIPELQMIDPAVRILAAMQTTDVKMLGSVQLDIDIDKSNAEVLKLALLTIGLNRDIQNLLHPRHSNGAIVKQLCQHDDNIVRQYSVWSVMENIHLTLDDLGIPFSDIPNQPVNVQAKLLQLASEREPNLKVRHQIIYEGTFADHPEARMGLAKGLVRTFYEGLEDLTINWYDTEADNEVKALLAEHFARFSDDCGPYVGKALSIIEAEPKMKDRIMLGAEGKDLYSTIRLQDLRGGTLDMFGLPPDLASMFQTTEDISKKVQTMKVLFLAANPVGTATLKIDREASDLKEQLAMVRDVVVKVDVEHAWAIRTDKLQREVLNSRPAVLHFSGHGDRGLLVFEDAAGTPVEVSGKALANLVSLMPSIKCVILNACYSQSVAKLLAPHVDAVIGCSVSISDAAALMFTGAFYRALAHGESFKRAYDLAKNDVELNGFPKEAKKYMISFAP